MAYVGQFILATSPWVGQMSTDHGHGHCYGKNSEFCTNQMKVQ